MNIFDILFYITVYPLQFLIETVFYFFAVYTKTPYVDTLFFVSIIINILALPIYNLADKLQEKEKAIQNKLKPKINDIKAVYKGDKRYMLIRACQRINGYKTIYAFRGTIGLLIQIPFFFAAYNFFSNLEVYNLVSFGAIEKLSEPDALIKLQNMSVNLLPFIMTFFSVLATLVYTKNLKLKEKLPLFAMSAFFLVFLYNSPAVLLIYWTINCAFSFIKNVVILNKNVFIKCRNNIISNKKTMKVFSIIGKSIFILYNILLLYMTVLYFLQPNIEQALLNDPSLEIFSLHIKTYINLLSILILLFLIIAFDILKKKNIFGFINIEKNKRLNILISSSILLTLLVGLFIPSALIGSSGQEFESPFILILTNFSTYLGIFFLYPVGLYFLLSDKSKNTLTFLMSITALIALLNAFVMVGDYGVINPDISFDFPHLLKSNILQIIINTTLMLLPIVAISLIYKKHKTLIIQNIYIVCSLALFFTSCYDFTKIAREQKILSEIKSFNIKALSKTDSILNFSKDGENIFIIILDRGFPSYFKIAFDRIPELKKAMDGFKWYINNISFNPYSFPSTQTIYGGYEYMPYELYTNNKGFDPKSSNNEAMLMMPKLFSDLGYEVTMIDTPYSGWSKPPNLSIFEPYTNIKAYHNKKHTMKDALAKLYNIETEKELENIVSNIFNIRKIRFSLFRILPMFMRYEFYGEGGWYIPSNDNFVMNSSISEYLKLKSLPSMTTTSSNGNYFNMVHNSITHAPYYFNNNYKPSGNRVDVPKNDYDFFGNDFNTRTYYAHVASLELLADYFGYLKENNIYDNTKIIIVSDHGYYYSPSLFMDIDTLKGLRAYHSLLLIKDFNSKNELEINTNFMTIAEVPYLATTHLKSPTNPFTGKIITNDQKNNGVIVAEGDEVNAISYDFVRAYKVYDNIFDENNWKEIDIK